MNYTKDQKRILEEAGFSSVFDSTVAYFIAAFAIALGASNTIIGIVGAIPFLATALAEGVGAYTSTKHSRRSIYVYATVPAYALWFITGIVSFFGVRALTLVVVVYFLSMLLLQFVAPSWLSWISDLVPIARRGRFMSQRNKIINIGATVTLLLGGLYLDMFPREETVGFSILFVIGALFGMQSVRSILHLSDPKKSTYRFSISDFWQLTPELKRLSIFSFCFYSAVSLGQPFVFVYLLRNLHLSYTWFVLVTATALLAKVLTSSTWGRISDEWGDKVVFLISCTGVSLITLLFLFVPATHAWTALFVSAFAGAAWAGVDLSLLNMFLGYTTSEKRAVQMATFITISSLPYMVFPILGGLITDHVVLFGLAGVPLVFVLSFILRLISIPLLSGLPEPRVKKKATFKRLVADIFTFHPTQGSRRVHRFFHKHSKTSVAGQQR